MTPALPRLVVLSLVVPVLLAGTLARAQVNTENLRKRVKVTGYSFLLEGSLTGDLGNTEGIAAGGGVGAGWGHEEHLVFAYARADYSRYSDVTSVNKTFAHVRYNYELEPWLWGELYAQAQSDEFQRLTLRSLFGVGPRFRVVHELAPTNLDVYVGTAYMLERDVIFVAAGARDQELQIWHRWSNYVTAQWQVDERVIFTATLYAQPALTDFADVRLLDETLFTFKVTKVLAAGISGTVRYDSEPPTRVLTTDVEIKNTLTATF